MQIACLQQGCGDQGFEAAREIGLRGAFIPRLHERRKTFLK
jgi:hypothetical protein